MQVRVLKATKYFLVLVTLAAASVDAQAQSPRSPLSGIAHGVSTWFTGVTGTDGSRRREGSLRAPLLIPLPRPRPTELTSIPVAPNAEPSKPAAAPVPANQEPAELATSSVAPNKEPAELTTPSVERRIIGTYDLTHNAEQRAVGTHNLTHSAGQRVVRIYSRTRCSEEKSTSAGANKRLTREGTAVVL